MAGAIAATRRRSTSSPGQRLDRRVVAGKAGGERVPRRGELVGGPPDRVRRPSAPPTPGRARRRATSCAKRGDPPSRPADRDPNPAAADRRALLAASPAARSSRAGMRDRRRRAAGCRGCRGGACPLCAQARRQVVPLRAVLEHDALAPPARRGCGRPRRSRGAAWPRRARRSVRRRSVAVASPPWNQSSALIVRAGPSSRAARLERRRILDRRQPRQAPAAC